MKNKIKIAVCDDHPIFRNGLVQVINAVQNYEVIGTCSDGMQLLEVIKTKMPDVAIVDISMPEMDGIEVAKQILKEELSTKIIILTMYKEKVYFDRALEAGVKGYLLKENATRDLLSCIEKVVNGEFYISSTISNFLFENENRFKAFHKKMPVIESLTETELKILKMIGENKTSKEIADEMCISYRTVENHRQHICDKLNLHGPHKLLEFALENKNLL